MIAWSVRARFTIMLTVVLLLVFGMLSYNSLPRESAPDIPVPYVMVQTVYIGVSPEDIEGLVTIPMENELASLRDVKKMRSSSVEGVSIVFLEFEPDVDIEDALQKVRDRVNRAKPKLPADAEEPSVAEISFSDIPVAIVTLAGGVTEDELKRLAERMEEEISRVPGVLDTILTGGTEREVQVLVDPVRLAHYQLKLRDVIGAIGSENVNVPGGNVAMGDANMLLRVPGEFKSAEELEEVAVKRVGDVPVFLRDVARIVDGTAERETFSRMNGAASVSLAVTKRAGANILEVCDAVKAIAAEHSTAWPEGVDYRVLGDQSKFVRDMVTDLENNIYTALILVVAVLVFSLGLRSSLYVALSIPLSMLMSFIALQALGFTLNMIVLFSLILALGMLVDNAIVVVENIYRHMEDGKDAVTASIDGAREVAVAVTASTATTVVAFLPLVFWQGIMGQFMGYLPKTVIVVLLGSLVAAVLLLPALTAAFLRVKPRPGAEEGELPLPTRGVMGAYRRLLEGSIRWRYASAAAMFALLVVTVVIYGFFNHGTEFFPDTEPNRAMVYLRAPEGTTVDTTDRLMRSVESLVGGETNTDVYVAETGVAGGQGLGGSNTSPNSGRLTLDFLPGPNDVKEGETARVERTSVTIDRLRRVLVEIPGAEVTIEKEEMGPPVGAAIAVEVSGDDFHAVGELAQKVRRELEAKVPGAADLKDDYRVGRPELRIRVDRGAAKRVGVDTNTIGDTVRTAVAGTVASKLRRGEDEWDIVVKVDPAFTDDVQGVLGLLLPGSEMTSPDTYPVPLSAVASYELAGGSGTVQHIDQDLVVTIEGDIAAGYNENEVRAEVAALIAAYPTPEGMTLRQAGADDEQREATEFLQRAFLLAVALILVVLITQFNSLVQPMVILATVVLSLIGVLWGLLLTGTAFGVIMTGLGVISLAGVVVNNAIVLLDYVQQLETRGYGRAEALVRAGILRFRPVMLTAITTVLGLVPMAVGVSYDFTRLRLIVGGSSTEFWGPMAVAVIFGLSLATILTLVMVPTFYTIADDLGRLQRWLWTRLTGGGAGTLATAKVLPLLVVLGGAAWSQPAVAAVTLEEALAAADTNNRDLLLIRQQTAQVETLKPKAWSLVQPTVTASGSYAINQYEILFEMNIEDFLPSSLTGFIGDIPEQDPVVIQPKTALSGSLNITQPLFNGSALPLMRAANHQIAAAQLDEGRARQQVHAGVARAFYGVTTAREGLRLAEEATVLAGRQLELAQAREQAGMATRRDVLQAELGVSQAERDVASARAFLAQAELSFERLTGLPGSSELAAPPPPSVPTDRDGSLRQAQEARSDLTASTERVAALSYQRRATLIGWALPNIQASFSEVYSENTGFSEENLFWVLTFSGRWTLWDGGFKRAQAKEEAAMLAAAELMELRARDGVEEEVRLAWEELDRAEASLAAMTREIALAEESLELAERSYQAGMLTGLELEQARLGLTRARYTALSEKFNRDLAVIGVQVATGTF